MPNRILRDWTTSETVDGLTAEQEAGFARLLMAVDDFGRYTADPRLLAARLYPLRVGLPSAPHMLSIRDALAKQMLIKLYVVDGKEFLQIVKWDNTPRAKHSKFPECTPDAEQMHSTCYADAKQMHSTCIASAPVTGTVTEDRRPEPETDLLRSRKRKAFAYDPDFEAAWQAWPSIRKGEKGAAYKRWKQCEGRPPLDVVLASIEAHKVHCAKWLDGYVPEMVNWISGRGFDTTFDPNNTEWRP